MANWDELWGSKRLIRLGDNFWKGSRAFSCKNASLDALENALWDSTWPGKSGDYAPKCNRVVQQGGFRRNRGLVTAYYETERQPGKAFLLMGGEYTYRLSPGMIKDLGHPDNEGEHRIIQGPDGDDGKHEWIPYYSPGPYPIIILQTADEKVNVDKTLGYVGTTNEQGHSYIFGADADELLMLKVEMKHVHNSSIVYLDYHMAYNNKKWSKLVTSQLGVWQAVKRNVMAWNETTKVWEYDTTEADKKVMQFSFGKKVIQVDGADKMVDSEAEARQVFNMATWSELAGLTEW